MSKSGDPERAHKIRRLFRLGMSVEAATRAVDEDRVTLSLLDHLVGGARMYTREQAAQRAGLDVELAETIDRIAGLGDDARYSEAGVHQLALIARLTHVLPRERVIAQIRADIPALRSVALRTLDTAEELFLRAAQQQHDDPVDAALALAEVATPLLNLSSELIGQSYRRVVLELIDSDLVAQALQRPDETIEVAVGFVDVVGYTSLSARVDPTGLQEVLTIFEAKCQQVVESHPQVTLVKFMGDAGMFVSLDPLGLAEALHEVVQREEEEDDGQQVIPVSGGLAFGPALLRGGDYFGEPVNEAARLTDLARQHSVLASDRLKEVLEPHFRLRRLMPVNLHGIGRRRPYALRERLDTTDEEE